ncbi:TetR/AcrR family transcriptional regulator [Rathayibacter soli]|uniref:TetR/AcrR family transcriptional regulator n=1 Tax=Rathayibacter soli TaxID=3144168 RepID=UPI0027E58A3E|nr:TetR family transcriptional regulator C-terminal domain-containing protein [Glaciibacter superstes]
MSRTPGKKTERKAPSQRAAEISDAARRLALDGGLAAVTLRSVAARAGVASALVAHYQPNMDALVADTFATLVHAEIEAVTVLIDADPTAVDQLAHLLNTLLDGSRTDVTVIWVDAWTLGRRNEPLAARVRAEMDAWQTVVREILERGVAEGEFETDDAASLSWQILGMIDGLNAQALVRWGTATDRSVLLAHAVEGMLRLPRGTLAVA